MTDVKTKDQEVPTIAILEMASDIVAAYVSHNAVSASDLPGVIRTVFDALKSLGVTEPEAPVQEPAVPIKKSVTDDFIICLEDGKKFKSLKRHIKSSFGMTPDEYRKKWGLPADYPMTCPNYSKKRKQLAIENGLGRNRAEAA